MRALGESLTRLRLRHAARKAQFAQSQLGERVGRVSAPHRFQQLLRFVPTLPRRLRLV